MSGPYRIMFGKNCAGFSGLGLLVTCSEHESALRIMITHFKSLMLILVRVDEKIQKVQLDKRTTNEGQ